MAEPFGMQLMMMEAQDIDNYKLDRSYVYAQSDWLDSELMVNPDEGIALMAIDDGIELMATGADNVKTLQTDVFYSANPQIVVTDNGLKMMIWTADIKTRTSGNHTAVVYSVYNEETSTWDILDSHADGSSTNPSSDGTLYTISNYNNNVTYNKFRFNISNIVNYMYIDRIRIYGTKEGEDSIYDLFALPPSVEDTTGAKNYIVATSGNDRDYNFTTEERVIGTWIDGKPIYRKVFTGTRSTSPVNLTSEGHYNEIINYYGYFINDQEKLPIHMPYNNNTNFIIVTINNNNIRLEQYGYASGTDYKIVIEYTKTI